MYESFYGLRARPFDLTPDLDYLLLTPKHQEAIAHLEYGLSSGTGIALLLGEPGTGKTTLLHKVLASGPGDSPARVVCLSNPALSRAEFFDFLANGFGLSPAAARSKTRFLRDLQRTIVGADGRVAVLVIDEAQCLSDELLEEVRLLANTQSGAGQRLRVILAGQPALGDRLNQPAFQQLKQRIGLRCLLPPLDLHETAGYIAYRIGVAGGSPAGLFSRDAVLAIHERSRGIPRTINVICENALLTGFAVDQRPVESDTVLEVCADFDLEGHGPMPAAAAPARFEPAVVHGISGRRLFRPFGAPRRSGSASPSGPRQWWPSLRGGRR